jgi:hypothetical protein
MPKKSRIDAAGALHNIIAGGIERKSIFRDNKGRNNFLERLNDKDPQSHSQSSCL